jgi:hypothetical protein
MKDCNVCYCIYHVDMEELRAGFNHMWQKARLHSRFHYHREAICEPIDDSTTSCVGSIVATLLWVKWEDETLTPKVRDLESSGTPECLVLDSKAQNTSHRGNLSVIGKVLKRRYRKWPRIGHLDIYSPSYGQKKGRESNWQFDSRPLKVKNRPLPDLRIESATRRWKDLDEGYNFDLDLVGIRLWSREIWAPKVPGLQPGHFRDNFRTPTWESREKEPFGCSPRGVLQRILYGGRWWLPPSPGRGVSCVSKCPWLVPTPKGVPKCELTFLWLVLDADSSLII